MIRTSFKTFFRVHYHHKTQSIFYWFLCPKLLLFLSFLDISILKTWAEGRPDSQTESRTPKEESFRGAGKKTREPWDPIVPFSGGWGRTPGSMYISDKGAGRYTVPLKVPDAPIKPTLFCDYNHQFGNGLMGLGSRLL